LDRLSDYEYTLPEELIAQTPLEDRAASRLLWLQPDGTVEHLLFRDVLDLFDPGDLLVMNDTRVSALRLLGRKSTGASVEALLLREMGSRIYEALVKPGKRLKLGSRIIFSSELCATVVGEAEGGLKQLEFDPVSDLTALLDAEGLVPLPPYIHSALADKERYQTVYGVAQGSAAAPTAGLHFTQEIMNSLRVKGVQIATVTLHVGIDTFRPVQVEDLDEHRMHGERCELSKETADLVNHAAGRIIAVGTTTVRTLESFAIGPRRVEAGIRDTRLFIRPGYRFNVIDGMFTNFHLPGTTMLVMLSALVGREALLNAYGKAIDHGYRFLSFGDSMLILENVRKNRGFLGVS